MYRKYLNLAFLFCFFSLKSQNIDKSDCTWILGYSGGKPGQNNEEFGGMYMEFNDTQYDIKKFNIYGGPISSVTNDTSGNILFYSTGCSIFSKNGEIIENGDSINSETLDYGYECNFGGIYSINNSNISLPIPDTKSSYLLFNPQFIQTDDSSAIWNKLLYNKVDITNGFGKVVEKNIEIISEDSLWDAAAAVRHGNGRDWWVVIARGKNRDFWEILIDPSGIKEKKLITTPPPYTPFTIKTEKDSDNYPFVSYIPVDEYQLKSSLGQIVFSPNGEKMCRIIRSGEVEIYDFDRCSGRLEFRRSIFFDPYAYKYGTTIPCCGISFSPNSRFIYFNNSISLYQFDMCEDCIENGSAVLISNYDKFLDENIFPTNFFIMRLAPNGKIYISSPNSTHFFHVINSPNQKGYECDFRQHEIQLPRLNLWTLPYFPNYNLFDLSNSPCDTLGINDPHPIHEVIFDELKIYPSPANEYVNLFLPKCEGGRLKIMNAAGQLISYYSNVIGKQIYQIPTIDWPSGVYFFSIVIESNKPVTRKIMVSH
jgi:hypothetical protein